MTLPGRITGYDGRCLTIEADYENTPDFVRKNYQGCEIRLIDGRSISYAQRNKIFALVSDIADYATDIRGSKGRREQEAIQRQLQLAYLIDTADKEAVRRQLTVAFCMAADVEPFSLSNVDMSTARDFIDWLVELCVVNAVPCNDTLLNRCEDIGRYLYACVANRRCAICGRKAEIHEVERVGMGRNRQKMSHLGQEVQPLCRYHHTEVDQIGQQSFNEKYHLQTIQLDRNLCRILGWKP